MTLWGERVELDNKTESDHFENIQSTNWQTLRFKPPPPNSPIGWRVEFRPMECSFTEYENAAFSIFIVLVTRVLLRYIFEKHQKKFHMKKISEEKRFQIAKNHSIEFPNY
jgi:hypothetical protein